MKPSVELRTRRVCPKCGSVQVHKIRKTTVYRCEKSGCGWEGAKPTIVTKNWSTIGRTPHHSESQRNTSVRLAILNRAHTENALITKAQLMRECGENRYFVNKHWADWFPSTAR